MAIQTRHPAYLRRHFEWRKMRDTYAGEEVVKGARTLYLPPTEGQILDGMSPFAYGDPGLAYYPWSALPGSPYPGVPVTYARGAKPSDDVTSGPARYEAYLMRSIFPSFVQDAVEVLLGMMQTKPPTIELPPQMEPMRERASSQGETLEMLLRRISEHQLIAGRLGLLADLPEQASLTPTPYIGLYSAEAGINWDDGTNDAPLMSALRMVVLDESGLQRVNGFDWKMRNKYRVLLLGDVEGGDPAGGVYRYGVFTNEDGSDKEMSFDESRMQPPTLRGQTLDEIPFTFVNTKDLIARPVAPPLLSLANLCLAIYRGEADLRQHLHKQGQDTLVIIGQRSTSDEDEPIRTGSGSKIEVPQGGDAKFIGSEGKGLEQQIAVLDADKKQAAMKSGELLDKMGAQRESGEALSLRIGAETASLRQIALTGAAGLERVLRLVAKWMGADPEKVVVQPNLDFADLTMDGAELGALVSAKVMGAPISRKTIHSIMQDRGLTELSYEEEVSEIEEEEPLLGSTAAEALDGQERSDAQAQDAADRADANAEKDRQLEREKIAAQKAKSSGTAK